MCTVYTEDTMHVSSKKLKNVTAHSITKSILFTELYFLKKYILSFEFVHKFMSDVKYFIRSNIKLKFWKVKIEFSRWGIKTARWSFQQIPLE